MPVKKDTPEDMRLATAVYVVTLARELRYSVIDDERSAHDKKSHARFREMYEQIPAQALVAKSMMNVIASEHGLDPKAMVLAAADALERTGRTQQGEAWPKKLPKRLEDWQAIENTGLDILMTTIRSLNEQPREALAVIVTGVGARYAARPAMTGAASLPPKKPQP